MLANDAIFRDKIGGEGCSDADWSLRACISQRNVSTTGRIEKAGTLLEICFRRRFPVTLFLGPARGKL